ncbi:MAG: HNH endonuclease [Proteobacteria bacterium]|nr:HNH endonuclease [Pseudomonadota bacterium]
MKWTPEEDAAIREHYPSKTARELAATVLPGRSIGSIKTRALALRVRKAQGFSKNNAAIRATHFQRGQSPWNKGKHYVAGGRSAETRFKKGSIPHTHLPIGSERDKEGVLWRKVADTRIKPQDWLPVHHIVWLEAGGEIPSGHVLCFKDGNRRNFSLDNLELATRAEIMRRNSVNNYGPEVAAIIRLNGSLKRAIVNRGD